MIGQVIRIWRDPLVALVCAAVGCEWSWSEGVMLGFDRPVCTRCRRVAA